MKLLRLLLLSTLPMWALTACSPKPATCDASKCRNGCCDANGHCQLGAVPEACGTNGLFCAQCLQGQTCSLGICQPGGTGGGGNPMLNCAAGKTACSGSCVDTTIDERNCGACGLLCSSNQFCSNGACDFTCNVGFHRCGNQCVSNTSVNSCGGSSCTPCARPANAMGTCDGTACDFTCEPGFHRCGNQCLSNTDVNSCGSNCTPCSASVPAFAIASCDGTRCGFVCDAGFVACGGECLPEDFVNACGPSCTACTAGGAQERATCIGGVCGSTCVTSCNAACVDVQRDPLHCGACGIACASAEMCTGGQCRASCSTGVAFAGVLPVLQVEPAATYRMRVDDLNGDGRADLVDNGPAAGLHVRYANADGSLQAPILISSASFSSRALAFALADLDADGLEDLIAVRAATGTNILIALNTGTGFAPPTLLALSNQTPSGGIAAADFNQDGRVDLMVSTTLFNFFFLQTSTGGWPATFSGLIDSAIANVTFAAVGDFDSNGSPDLALAKDAQYQVVLRNNNPWPTTTTNVSAAFTAGSTAGATSVSALQVADLNADLKPDVLVRTAGNVRWLRGTGMGLPVAEPLVSFAGTGPVIAEDLNVDGLLDLAAAGQAEVRIALASGPGTWGPAFSRPVNASPNLQASIGVGQLVGNPAPEIFTANQSATAVEVSVLVNEGGGQFPGVQSRELMPVAPLAAGVSGDIDGDGDTDLVLSPALATNHSGLAQVYLGANDGTFTGLVSTPTLRGDELALGRLEANASLELVAINESGTTPGVDVFLGGAGGVFSAAVSYATSGTPMRLQIVDFDGDLAADVVVSTDRGIEWLQGNGQGALAPSRPLVTGLTYGSVFRVADLNLDGRQDIALSSGLNGDVSVYLGVGNGAVRPRPFVTVPGGGVAWDLVAADLDADGRPDLALSTFSTVLLFQGNGLGGLVPRPAVPGIHGRLFVVDMDNDGILDLVSTQLDVAVARGLGNFTWGPVSFWIPGRTLAWRVGFVDHFDADALRDVVVVESGSQADLVTYRRECR